MIVLAFALAAPAHAETVSVDAHAAVQAPKEGYLKLGSAKAPDGTTLGVNDRFFTIDGRPWLPVMGEIHFVRLPHEEWDEALAKIKASGVDIVSSYVLWNYHEEKPGQFDWTGDRDLRRFVELAAKRGLKVVLRIGPWAHGEVRHGGHPDWIARLPDTRSSDPAYMRYAGRYWGQLATQIRGLLWKDGGPIIGIQLENEYTTDGPGRGAQHIADLKTMAIRLGLDVPFYTVTGWGGAPYPRGEILPVAGGYPDQPWAMEKTRLPPNETYAFRFGNRMTGDLGAQTHGASNDADLDIPFTPFVGAEFGAGVPTMYRRRPRIAPDDGAAMVPVQLGAGVNLYGYYMYHGGRNAIAGTTLEESSAVGDWNDLPIIDYGFQAPFGEYGEPAPVLGHLRPFHYFLESYGAQLAPMTVRKPDVTPAAVDDLKTLRWSLRANGESAFVFVNNHVRQYASAEHRDVRFSIALPDEKIVFPSRGVTIADGTYFIWPVGLDLDGQTLSWASAQPVTRVASRQGPVHVFMASDGIAPEFAFPAGTRVSGGSARTEDGRVIVRVARPGRGTVLTIARPSGASVRILVLDRADAQRLSRVEFAGAARLVLADGQVIERGNGIELVSAGKPDFSFAVWPALPARSVGRPALGRARRDGLFTRYVAHAAPRASKVVAVQLKAPGAAPPLPDDGGTGRVLPPKEESFSIAGAWALTIPANVLDGLDDAYLKIDWTGDIGRLYSGATLIDDRFFDGSVWRIGLRRNAAALSKPLTLTILPLRADSPVYLDEAKRPAMKNGQAAALLRASIEPQYRLEIE